MASGIVRKAMVYLGLTDDEYEDYDAYDDRGRERARGVTPNLPRVGQVRCPRFARSAGSPPTRPMASP